MWTLVYLVMTLLDENKTEAYLLRVLIEAGRRVNNYPERRVCILLAFEMHSKNHSFWIHLLEI